jgi:hypothetical protein
VNLVRSYSLGLLALLGGCGDVCRNAVAVRARSPDGARDAVIFQRDCGATTAFSTQISVLDRDGQPKDGGTVFSADGDHGAARAGPWGGPCAEARWLAADHLLIRYAAGSRIFHQVDRSGAVRVTYEAIATVNPAQP